MSAAMKNVLHVIEDDLPPLDTDPHDPLWPHESAWMGFDWNVFEHWCFLWS